MKSEKNKKKKKKKKNWKKKKRKKKKQIVDQIAATKILQEFMDTKKKMTFDIEKYKKLINDTE